jgi:hypothetical protein
LGFGVQDNVEAACCRQRNDVSVPRRVLGLDHKTQIGLFTFGKQAGDSYVVVTPKA